MVRRRNSRTRYVTRFVKKSGVRRPRKNDVKKYGTKALKGLAGLAVSVPLTMYGQKTGNAMLIEAGQRGGAVVASALGGTTGQVAYQAADAAFDRFVTVGGAGISGSQGQVYL